MDINKAIEHFEWKLKNVWKPSQKDIDAYNAILEYKDITETYNMSQNESLAKLWINTFIMLSLHSKNNSKDSIRQIDEMLSKSVYEWVKILNKEIPHIKLNLLNKNDYVYNVTKRLEQDKEMVENEPDKLNDALEPVKIEDTIKFLETQITRVINKFEK